MLRVKSADQFNQFADCDSERSDAFTFLPVTDSTLAFIYLGRVTKDIYIYEVFLNQVAPPNKSK